MELGPWISMATVLAVPLLVTSDTGRSWLIRGKYAERAWVLLTTAAVLGVVTAFGVFRSSVRVGAGVLVATPFIQGIVFVVADRLFQTIAGRVPVSFDEARYGRRTNGKRHWPDAVFWVVVCLGLIVGAVFLCAHFDIEFPSRARR